VGESFIWEMKTEKKKNIHIYKQRKQKRRRKSTEGNGGSAG
jgi:hypothetical protein